MNRNAHYPRNTHPKPTGFDAGACVRTTARFGFGRWNTNDIRMDSTG